MQSGFRRNAKVLLVYETKALGSMDGDESNNS